MIRYDPKFDLPGPDARCLIFTLEGGEAIEAFWRRGYFEEYDDVYGQTKYYPTDVIHWMPWPRMLDVMVI